jgi:hypothetical protein
MSNTAGTRVLYEKLHNFAVGYYVSLSTPTKPLRFLINSLYYNYKFLLLRNKSPVHFLSFNILNQQNTQIKIHQTNHKIRFTLDTNSYMYQHQGAIFREFINNKGL